MKVVDFVKKNYIFRSRVGERGLYMKRSGFVGWIGGSILLLAGYYPSVSHLLSNISTQCDDVTSYVVASDNVDAAKIAAMSSLFSLENAGNSEFSKQMMAYSLSQDQAGSDSKLATIARRKSENAVKTIKNGEFANCRYAKGSVRTNFYADAIRAVLQPADTNYLFFVADGRGGHKFSRTYEQHKKNQADWRVIKKLQNKK